MIKLTLVQHEFMLFVGGAWQAKSFISKNVITDAVTYTAHSSHCFKEERKCRSCSAYSTQSQKSKTDVTANKRRQGLHAKHGRGGDGLMVRVDDLSGLFQASMILQK